MEAQKIFNAEHFVDGQYWSFEPVSQIKHYYIIAPVILCDLYLSNH